MPFRGNRLLFQPQRTARHRGKTQTHGGSHSRWLGFTCVRHSRIFTGLSSLYHSFCEWQSERCEWEPDLAAFEALLVERDFLIGEVAGTKLVSGLAFRDDLEAIRRFQQAPEQPKPAPTMPAMQATETMQSTAPESMSDIPLMPAGARDSSTRSSASETLVPTDFVRSARFTRHLRRSVSKAPHLFSKALLLLFKASTREGRTVSVRPRLADRLAAKDKTRPRVLDGNSAHPRTPGACCAWLQAKRPRAFFL